MIRKKKEKTKTKKKSICGILHRILIERKWELVHCVPWKENGVISFQKCIDLRWSLIELKGVLCRFFILRMFDCVFSTFSTVCSQHFVKRCVTYDWYLILLNVFLTPLQSSILSSILYRIIRISCHNTDLFSYNRSLGPLEHQSRGVYLSIWLHSRIWLHPGPQRGQRQDRLPHSDHSQARKGMQDKSPASIH